MTILREGIRKARKNHYCNGSETIQSYVHEGIFTISELRTIVKARREEYKILKGTNYYYQVNTYMGEIHTWKCRTDMYDLIDKYNLWDYD